VAIFYCLRFETSLFVASYNSQGHGGGIRPRLHTVILSNGLHCFLYRLCTDHPQKTDQLLRNGYHVLSGLSTHTLPTMDTQLLRIRCCKLCLPVCYLAMDDLLLLYARWLEHVYLFVP
jgi:hypothetical protein